MFGKLPPQLAQRVLAAFPDDESVASLVEHGSRALPGVIRIMSSDVITADEVVETLEGIGDYDNNHAYALRLALLKKAQAVQAGTANSYRRGGGLEQLAADCEAAINTKVV